MSSPAQALKLSRRERQIMDIVYRLGQATVAQVIAGMDDPPGYSAVRALMRILEEKGHLSHTEDGTKYIYRPTRPTEQAGRSALLHMVQTFFDGSVERAVAALLDSRESPLDELELKQLEKLIRQPRKEGR